MADRPLPAPLPADLPEDWTSGQIVAPDGADVGLSEQHGYNYLMGQVNAAQRALNTINEGFDGISGKRTCRFVIGTPTAGWTQADCDYLCDGTDDQVEIQAAIDAAPENGCEIVLLDGEYSLGGVLTVNKSGIWIHGNGESTKLVRKTTDGESSLNYIIALYPSTRMTDITYQGAGATDDGFFEFLNFGTIENVSFFNCGYGCVMLNPLSSAVDVAKVSGCRISGGEDTHVFVRASITQTINAVVSENYTSNVDYDFNGWQEGGQTVSTSTTYTFTATADRALVAQFTAAPAFNPTWTQGTLPTSGTWVDMCYAAGKFVLLGNTGILLYSSNGTGWTNSGQSSLSKSFYKVVYGGGRYCAFDNDTTRYSSNATGWATSTDSANVQKSAVAYGPDGFVMASNYGSSSRNFYYSTNGYSHTHGGTLPVFSNYYDMAYGAGKYVLLATNSNSGLYYKWGGSWTTFSIPVQGKWDNIVYGDDRFIAVSNSSTNKAMYSLDGVTWVESTMPVTATWNALAYGDGVFVALAENSDIVAYTKDGATWKLAENKLPSAITARAFGYGNGRFVATYGQTIVYT